MSGSVFNIGQGVVPSIDNGLIVCHLWANSRDVIAYRLSDMQRLEICNSVGNQCNPEISGNIVVWHDDRDGSSAFWDIWGYNIIDGHKFLIAQNIGNANNYPAIDGSIVVWDNGGFDLLANQNLSVPIGIHPDVSGKIVVWEQDGDIYGALIPEPTTLSLLCLGLLALIRKKN